VVVVPLLCWLALALVQPEGEAQAGLGLGPTHVHTTEGAQAARCGRPCCSGLEEPLAREVWGWARAAIVQVAATLIIHQGNGNSRWQG
jgi:hypothetical protein